MGVAEQAKEYRSSDMTKIWLGCALWIGLACGTANAHLIPAEFSQFASSNISNSSLIRPKSYLKSCEIGKGIWTATSADTNSFQQFEIFGHSSTNGVAQISKVSNDKVIWVSRGAYRCVGSPLLCSVEFSDRTNVDHLAKTTLSKSEGSIQIRSFIWGLVELETGGGLDAFWQAGHTPNTDGVAMPHSEFILTECKQ